MPKTASTATTAMIAIMVFSLMAEARWISVGEVAREIVARMRVSDGKGDDADAGDERGDAVEVGHAALRPCRQRQPMTMFRVISERPSCRFISSAQDRADK